MESSIFALLLISMLSIASATSIPEPDCHSCYQPPSTPTPTVKPPVTGPHLPVPPVTVPHLPLPPVTVPHLPVPPVTVPHLPVPPVTVPNLPVPPVTVPHLPVPPVTVPNLPVPPVTVPNLPLPPGILPPVPVLNPPKTPVLNPPTTKPCPTPAATCPIDTLKLGACLNVLGAVVKIGQGIPSGNKCCPVISGLVEFEAAACLCTTLKLKALNLKIYVPIALELLISCGKTPPPGFTCAI